MNKNIETNPEQSRLEAGNAAATAANSRTLGSAGKAPSQHQTATPSPGPTPKTCHTPVWRVIPPPPFKEK